MLFLAEAHRPDREAKLLYDVTVAKHSQVSQGQHIEVFALKLEHRLTRSREELFRGLGGEMKREYVTSVAQARLFSPS